MQPALLFGLWLNRVLAIAAVMVDEVLAFAMVGAGRCQTLVKSEIDLESTFAFRLVHDHVRVGIRDFFSLACSRRIQFICKHLRSNNSRSF